MDDQESEEYLIIFSTRQTQMHPKPELFVKRKLIQITLYASRKHEILFVPSEKFGTMKIGRSFFFKITRFVKTVKASIG